MEAKGVVDCEHQCRGHGAGLAGEALDRDRADLFGLGFGVDVEAGLGGCEQNLKWVQPTDVEATGTPTLSWRPLDGAASYWLVVHDSSGLPFWAWTGAETSVRVGGGDTANTNQTAAVHEEMTWRVAAFDANGQLIALSDERVLTP